MWRLRARRGPGLNVALAYPTLDQVAAASVRQLALWSRFLDSPGISALGRSDFEETMSREAVIQRTINARFLELGGWTPELSKSIGWDQ